MKDYKKSSSLGRKSFGERGSYGPKRGPSFGARSFDKPTERFQATCNECHKLCEVPFRPNGKKPVYCSDCFRNKPEDAPSFGAPREYRKTESAGTDLSKQFEMLNLKLDRLITAIESKPRA